MLVSELDVLSVGDADTCRTYVFDVKRLIGKSELRDAVVFARQQLLQEVTKKGYNVLLLERCVLVAAPVALRISSLFYSWKLTVLRRGKQNRIQVEYNGRGQLANVVLFSCY